jgi:predicted Zn-dependent protease
MINLFKILVCCAAVLIAGCDALGRWKTSGTKTLVSFIPREVDQKLGELAETSQLAGKTDDRATDQVHQSLTLLAEPLVRRVDLSPLKLKFEVMPASVPNAFAFPHGRIFVTSKLLEISKRPEEILAVLSHEIAHVVQRHSMQQVVTQLGTTVVINLVFGDLGALADLAGAGGRLLGLKFSRDHEREADTVGADLLRQAKLPLGGVAGFFELMQDFEKSKAGLTGKDEMLSFLSTHPPTQERIDAARNLLSEPTAAIPSAQVAAYQELKKVYK